MPWTCKFCEATNLEETSASCEVCDKPREPTGTKGRSTKIKGTKVAPPSRPSSPPPSRTAFKSKPLIWIGIFTLLGAVLAWNTWHTWRLAYLIPIINPISTKHNLSTLPPLSVVYAVGQPGASNIGITAVNSDKHFTVADSDCDEAEPAWSHDQTKIVFQSNCNYSYDLVEFNLKEKSLTWLTSTAAFDEREPDYSFDGKYVVFQRTPKDSNYNRENGTLHYIDLKRQIEIRLSPNNSETVLRGRGPVWSPNGMKLAYMSLRAGFWQIYVYDFLYSHEQLISFNCPSHCLWPEWSPDGQALAYSVTNSDFTSDEIWIYSFTEGVNRQWMSGGVDRPSWSKHNLIAFKSHVGLEIASIDGKQREILSSITNVWGIDWAE